MPHYLAIDQSTSGTKALLFDAKLELVDKVSREHKQLYPKAGWVEHDAEEIWGNALLAVRALLDRNGAVRNDLRSLSIANQRETVVVFEKGSGRPLCNAIVWQCRRGAELCREIERVDSAGSVRRKTGLKIDPYFSGSKLLWLARNEPDLWRRVHAGEALVGTIDAYLIYRLTEGKVFATDTTNASRTLLFDISKLDWDDELCALWETPKHALPEARDSHARFGETTLSGALDTPLPICGVMGDSQAALFAQGCFQPGSAKVTFGTGSSLLLNVGSEFRTASHGVLTTLAWSLNGKPTYAFEGIVISAASTLAWLRDQLGLFTSYDEVETMAESVEDSGGVYLVPAFSGLGLPHWKPDARAAIVGLSSQSDRRHIVRAGLESIAFQVYDALLAMREEAGGTIRWLRADGGSSANRMLMQLVSDLCGVELTVAAMPDCSALGAAMAGQLGMGDVASLGDFSGRISASEQFKPVQDDGRRDALLSGWCRAVKQTVGRREDAAFAPMS